MVSAPGAQLPLNLRLRDDATFDNYVAHRRVLTALSAVREPHERLLFLHGAGDGGKSHLLQAACHACDGLAIYLPLGDVAAMDPLALLESMEHAALICLDDLQAVVADDGWERALFTLYNTAQSVDTRLLIAADAPPRSLGIALPDLRSRLTAMLVCSVASPDDAERLEILIARAGRRGLTLSAEVARYVSHRAGRSLGELMSVLDALDRASLTHQRALSIPFVRQVMGWERRQVL